MKLSDWLAAWRAKTRKLKVQSLTLYMAWRDPRLPWYVRAFIALVAAYALSPIDLIPDFIPVLGYLDDLLLVPMGISLALRMIPAEVLSECQAKAEVQLRQGMPQARFMTAVIIAIWIVLLLAILLWAASRLGWLG